MSRPTTVPITPSVLRWAIDQSGYDLSELASAIDILPAQIEGWLSGENYPTTTEARKLAQKLHRPLAAFLLPSPPTAQPMLVEFRHSLQDRVMLNTKERRYLRRAKRFQDNVSWLSRELGIGKPTIPPRTLDSDPNRAAEDTRHTLGISTEEQRGWTTPSMALGKWRSALEQVGLLVFLWR